MHMRAPRDLERSVVIPVSVVTGACGDEVAGWTHDGTLELYVFARRGNGLANTAVEGLLAAVLGLPRRQVIIAAGHGVDRKLVQIDGLDEAEVDRALPGRRYAAAGAPGVQSFYKECAPAPPRAQLHPRLASKAPGSL
jgi:uncharacterized protein YggU (UPF0235/DUF167 family)